MLWIVNIPAEWVASGDLGALQTLAGGNFGPAEARARQGHITFTFEELESDGLPIFAAPGVADYIARQHDAVPHLLYFLAPEPGFGAIIGLVHSLLSDEERAATLASDRLSMPSHVILGLTDRLVTAAAYATRVGDDWRPVVERLLEIFPPDDRTYLYTEVEQTLLHSASQP